MTKEEILAKNFNADNYGESLREDLLIEFALNPSIDRVESAMEEYAKQECIAYQKFLFDTNINFEHLYKLYLQSKEINETE